MEKQDTVFSKLHERKTDIHDAPSRRGPGVVIQPDQPYVSEPLAVRSRARKSGGARREPR
jgi:hypothetical protein